MKLLPIHTDLAKNKLFASNPACNDSLQPSIDYYKVIGFTPPWICYYASVGDEIVGTAAYKGKPQAGKVEIAYGTFPAHEGKGIGTAICKQLVELAQASDPAVIITARTLPTNNASTSILTKNGFTLLGSIWDDADGEVWEWKY